MQSDLSCLGSGQRGVITELRFSGGKRRRLMELGFIPGATVMALQRGRGSPCGPPMPGALEYAENRKRTDNGKPDRPMGRSGFCVER